MEIFLVLIPATATVITAWLSNRKTERVAARIDAELSPNGGSSARDLLDRIASQQIIMSEKIDTVDHKIDLHLKDHK